MSVWPNLLSPTPYLAGIDGALLSVSIKVDSWLLEDLLDALAYASFPINPEIRHSPGDSHTNVEFPAYERQVAEVRNLLATRNFDPGALRTSSMLAAIRE